MDNAISGRLGRRSAQTFALVALACSLGCTQPAESIRLGDDPSELLVAALVAGDRVLAARAGVGSSAFSIESDRTLVVWRVRPGDVIEADGSPVVLERLKKASVRLAGAALPPNAETSCDRCQVSADSSGPAIVHDGDACPIPPVAEPRAFRLAGGSTAELPRGEATELAARARDQLLIDWGGACSCREVVEREDLLAPELVRCPEGVRGVPIYEAFAVGADGTAALASRSSLAILDPSGRESTHVGPELPKKVEDLLVLPGSHDVVATDGFDVAVFRRPEWFDVDTEVQLVPVALRRLGPGSSISLVGSGLLFDLRFPAIATCEGFEPGSSAGCRLEVFDHASCSWLKNRRSEVFVEAVRLADGGHAAITERGEVAVRARGGEWTCPEPIAAEGLPVAIDPPWTRFRRDAHEGVAGVIAAGDRLFACIESRLATDTSSATERAAAIATFDPGPARSPGHLRITALLRPGITCAGFLEPRDGKLRVLARESEEAHARMFELDAQTGSLARALAPPDEAAPVLEAETSTTGWTVLTRADGAVFRAPPGADRFQRIYGPERPAAGGYRAFVEGAGAVIAFGAERPVRIPNEARSCGEVSAASKDIPLVGLSTQAAATITVAALDSRAPDRALVIGARPGGAGFGAIVDLGTLAVSREFDLPIDVESLVAAVELTPGTFIIEGARAIHRLELEEDPPRLFAIDIPRPEGDEWLGASGRAGTVWVLGAMTLARITTRGRGQSPRIDLLDANDPSMCKTARPDPIGTPCIAALAASCADRVVLAVSDDGAKDRGTRVFQIAPETLGCSADRHLGLPLDGAFRGLRSCRHLGFEARFELVDKPRWIAGEGESLTIVGPNGETSRLRSPALWISPPPLVGGIVSGGRLIAGTRHGRLVAATEAAPR